MSARAHGPTSSRIPLARRADGVELLDAGLLDPSELQTNLADLARLNHLPGGTSTSARAIARLVGARGPIHVLDVGIGGGDMPLAFARKGWSVTGVDASPDVLAVARNVTRGAKRVRLVEAQATALPFPDGTFDVVHSSLLIHHLDPEDAVAALREMDRVARAGVVVNDLRRGPLALALTAALVVALGRCRATRHDGILSARRAYSLTELDELLAAAGLRIAWRSAAAMPRVVTAAVPASTA